MEILQRPEYLAQVQHYFGKETIVVLTGQRRVGKSYVLMSLRDLLSASDGNNVIYINKEKKDWDDIVTYKDLNKYIEEKYIPDKKNYILIDEVQEIKEFEKSVRHWRTEPGTDLVLTGSNAETLSSDLSTLLAARYHEVYIQALTYTDFIRFHKLEEGDEDAVRKIAEENGLEPEDAEDFILGSVNELATPVMAALGKLKVEKNDMQPEEIMEDWFGYIEACTLESSAMAAAVRKKGKSLKGCVALLLGWSFKNAKEVEKSIVQEAAKSCKEITTVGHGRAWLGIPGMKTARKLIRDYYLGAQK